MALKFQVFRLTPFVRVYKINTEERPNSDFLEETRSEKQFGEKQFEDSRLIRTPCYYGRFSLSLGIALTLSLNSTSFYAPVNADNRHLFSAQSTDCYRKTTSLMRKFQY